MRGPMMVPRAMAFCSETSMKSFAPHSRTEVNPAISVARAFSTA
jgi:hypothetical protein